MGGVVGGVAGVACLMLLLAALVILVLAKRRKQRRAMRKLTQPDYASLAYGDVEKGAARKDTSEVSLPVRALNSVIAWLVSVSWCKNKLRLFQIKGKGASFDIQIFEDDGDHIHDGDDVAEHNNAEELQQPGEVIAIGEWQDSPSHCCKCGCIRG